MGEDACPAPEGLYQRVGDVEGAPSAIGTHGRPVARITGNRSRLAVGHALRIDLAGLGWTAGPAAAPVGWAGLQQAPGRADHLAQ